MRKAIPEHFGGNTEMESYSESYKKAGVDVTAALQKSMEKKTKRDSKRHINNPKLNDHGGE